MRYRSDKRFSPASVFSTSNDGTGRAVTEPEATVQQAPAIAAEAGKTFSSPYPAAPTAGAPQAAAQEPDERDLRTDPVELLSLFPALVPYIRTLHPDWREFIEAAWWMRGRLGISDRLWREACEVFGSGIAGQARAAIAVGIVSSKPLDHFKSGPGGYFFGMVQKAKRGELHLEKTLWGMRKDGQGLGRDLRQILKHHLTC